MRRDPAKQKRLQLDPDAYETLRQEILRRDGWKCQACGGMRNLEVHHKRYRSQCGDDSEQNLITLCVTCHRNVHGCSRRPSYAAGNLFCF